MKITETPSPQIPVAKPQEMWLSKDGYEPVPEGAKTVEHADEPGAPAIGPMPEPASPAVPK